MTTKEKQQQEQQQVDRAATPAEDRGRLLTAEDLFGGGDEPLQRIELPMIRKGANPGVLYVRKLATEEVLEWTEMPADDNEQRAAKVSRQLGLFARAVCRDSNGTPMFSSEHDDKIGRIPIGVFNLLMGAIVGDMGGIGVMAQQAQEKIEAEKND